jgi:membrane-bound metal-dependent hydrolase YbcI (DUF457 family)
MPYAVTHVIIAIIIIDIIRHLIIKKTGNKNSFPMYYVFIGGLAGLLPDIDILFEFFIKSDIHRHFTHGIIFPLIFAVIGLFFLYHENKNKYKHVHKGKIKWSLLFFIIAAGISIHIFLDWAIEGYIYPFWPFSNAFYGLNPFPSSFYSNRIVPAIDAIIFLAWLWHEEHSRKINDFF